MIGSIYAPMSCVVSSMIEITVGLMKSRSMYSLNGRGYRILYLTQSALDSTVSYWILLLSLFLIVGQR